VRLLWADRLGGDTVVLLQGLDPAGRPALAEVVDRRVLRTDPLPDPGVPAVRLVEPADPAGDGTVLLVAPAGAEIARPSGDPSGVDLFPVGPGGVATVPAELGDRPAAVLDAGGRIVGSGEVPPAGTLTVARGPLRLVSPDRRAPAGAPPPAALYWAEARMLADRLDDRLGDATPTDVAVLDAATSVTLPGGAAALRSYEVRRDGRTWLVYAVWRDGRPLWVRFDDVAVTRPSEDVLVLRCWLPAERAGILSVRPVDGIELADLEVAAAGPGQRAVRHPWSAPLDGGYVAAYGPEFPTGPGVVRLVDDAGTARPPAPLPAYRP
jgi:hypothetical protein